MHEGACETRRQIPRPLAKGFGVLFAQARVHCDNRPRQIGLNHNYNMTFSISPRECQYSPLKIRISQWVNSVPPYVRKLHFMYEAIRTSGKCRWNIYRTSSKCRWSIYRTSRKRRGTLRIVHKVERSSPTVNMVIIWSEKLFVFFSHCYVTWCPLTTGIVASQCPLARDAALVTHHLTSLISTFLNPLKIILLQ